MHRSRRILVAAVAAVSTVSIHTASRAANVTWDGGGANDNLSTAVNWSADTLPAVGDSVFFAGATRTTPSTAGGAAQYLALFFNAGASAFNIGGANPITLGS